MWRAAQTNSLSLALAAISQPSHVGDSVGSWHFLPHSVDSPWHMESAQQMVK